MLPCLPFLKKITYDDNIFRLTPEPLLIYPGNDRDKIEEFIMVACQLFPNAFNYFLLLAFTINSKFFFRSVANKDFWPRIGLSEETRLFFYCSFIFVIRLSDFHTLVILYMCLTSSIQYYQSMGRT